MDGLEQMAQCKIAYYNAASALLGHIDDAEGCDQYESQLYQASEAYLQSLLDVAGSIQEDTSYRKALRSTADRIRPFILELKLTISHRRNGGGFGCPIT